MTAMDLVVDAIPGAVFPAFGLRIGTSESFYRYQSKAYRGEIAYGERVLHDSISWHWPGLEIVCIRSACGEEFGALYRAQG